jgi:hypothetical protein
MLHVHFSPKVPGFFSLPLCKAPSSWRLGLFPSQRHQLVAVKQPEQPWPDIRAPCHIGHNEADGLDNELKIAGLGVADENWGGLPQQM